MLGVESGGVGRRVEGGLAFEEDLLTEAKGKEPNGKRLLVYTTHQGMASQVGFVQAACPVLSCPALPNTFPIGRAFEPCPFTSQ